MIRFIGNINAKMDVKGRVFVPAAFRKILSQSGNEQLVLRKDVYQNCLILYPYSSWEEELTQLRAKLNKWDERQQATYRQFVLESEILELDSTGRILIPKRYLQMTGISGEVRFVGMDNTIEIWGRAELEKGFMSPDEFKQNIQKMLGDTANG